MTDKVKRIQRAIRWYAVSALIFTGFVIALVIMIPLQARLFDVQKQHLAYSRDVALLVMDSYFTRFKEIAVQLSTRADGRHIMMEYNEGKMSPEKAHEILTDILKNAFINHPALISITRLDKNNTILASVGNAFISAKVVQKIINSATKFYGPFVFGDQQYLVVTTPIKDVNQKKIGMDMLTFQLNELENMLYQKMKTELGKTFSFYIQDGEINWILNNKNRKNNYLISQNVYLNQALIHSAGEKKSGILSDSAVKNGVVMAYGFLPNTQWGAAVFSDRADLYHSIQHIILILIVIILFILMLFALGLSAVLKPLSGRLLLENKELEELLENSQRKLKSMNEQLYQLAMIDSLTNVLTRRAFYQRFEEELSRCKRFSRSCVLLFIDVDEFKKVNDVMGHDAGDFLLKTFAEHLIQSVRKEDMVARLGGDEFALLLTENPEESVVSDIVQRIRSYTQHALKYSHQKIAFEISIGISFYPADGDDMDRLLKAADERMYEDKSRNKDKK